MVKHIPQYLPFIEIPAICCFVFLKIHKEICFNYGKVVSAHASSTVIDWDCLNYKFCNKAHGYIFTGNLDIVWQAELRQLLKKGPKYRFSFDMNFELYKKS